MSIDGWHCHELDGVPVYRIPKDLSDVADLLASRTEENKVPVEESLEIEDRLVVGTLFGWFDATVCHKEGNSIFADSGDSWWVIKKSDQQGCWVCSYGMNKRGVGVIKCVK